MMKKQQQKKPPIEDDTSHFPCDIIQNILSRLPLKSLLRFKAVCKPWKATIDDFGFAKIHSNQLNSQSFCAVGWSDFDTFNLIKFQGQESYVLSKVEFPNPWFDGVDFLCFCESILLFKRYSDDPNFLLWNPFTGKYTIFSCPFDNLIWRKPRMSYGLCFDKYRDDYKVIVHVLRIGKYLVYSIKKDIWTLRRSKFSGIVDLEGIYVDGIVYWTMSDNIRSCCQTIIYFDPKDNSLRKLRKPKDLVPTESKKIFLTNMSGNLCLYAHDEGEMFKLWLLKESDGGRKRWMKLMTAVKRESPGRYCFNHPICLTSKNEVLFYDEHSTFTYCLEKRKFGELTEFPALREIVVFECLESLNFPATPRE